MEKRSEGRVFQRLHVIIHRRLAVVMTVRHISEKKVDLFRRNYIADVLRAVEMAKRETDHLIVHHRGAAAIPRIDRRVNLDAQTGRRHVVTGELDARDETRHL